MGKKKEVYPIELGEGTGEERDHEVISSDDVGSVDKILGGETTPVVNMIDIESRYQAHLKKVGGK